MSQDAPTPPPSIAGTSGYPTEAKFAASARCEILSKGVSCRPLIGSIEIPKRAGRAFRVAQGQVLRVRCHEGPQVADLIAFNADDPRERFGRRGHGSFTAVISGSAINCGASRPGRGP